MGGVVKNVNGAVWSSVLVVWYLSELVGVRGRRFRFRAFFVFGFGYVKGGGRGKNSWNLFIYWSFCC